MNYLTKKTNKNSTLFCKAIFTIFIVCILVFSASCTSSNPKQAEKAVATFITAIRENDSVTILKTAPFFKDYSTEEQTVLIQGFQSFFESNYTLEHTVASDNGFLVTVDIPQSDGSTLSLTFPCEHQDKKSWIILSNITSSISYSTY